MEQNWAQCPLIANGASAQPVGCLYIWDTFLWCFFCCPPIFILYGWIRNHLDVLSFVVVAPLFIFFSSYLFAIKWNWLINVTVITDIRSSYTIQRFVDILSLIHFAIREKILFSFFIWFCFVLFIVQISTEFQRCVCLKISILHLSFIIRHW